MNPRQDSVVRWHMPEVMMILLASAFPIQLVAGSLDEPIHLVSEYVLVNDAAYTRKQAQAAAMLSQQQQLRELVASYLKNKCPQLVEQAEIPALTYRLPVRVLENRMVRQSQGWVFRRVTEIHPDIFQKMLGDSCVQLSS